MPVARILITVALLILLAVPQARAEEPSEAAMAFAGQFSDDQLSGMLSRIGGRSEPMMALSQLNGQLVAEVFDLQIDAAVAKYGAQWQRNMALAWEPLLTAEEMASILTEGSDSPHAQKYVELRGDAGKAMQGLSQDLFRDILKEVIGETQASLAESAAAEQ